MQRRTVITVFGSGTVVAADPAYAEARRLGRAIAEAGWTVCNGGYGGTMAAAAEGAMEAGGHTIGVTCATIRRRSGPNRHIRQEIPTFDLFQRVNTLMRLADAYVVLPGGTGTLLELAAVWEFAAKRFLRPARPLVLLGDYWRSLVEIIGNHQPGSPQPLVAGSAAEAVTLLRQQPNTDDHNPDA